MFLRATKRRKDGKEHLYWSLVEKVRVGRRVFQRQALYLGELNDSQQREWQRAVVAFDDDGKVRQLKLFPADRAPEDDDSQIVRIRMDRLAVRNLRNWGDLWPVYQRLDDRIEAHIFAAFMALCLFQTLRAVAREHAPGLTPRQIIEKFSTVKMVDVVMPTTDGRIITLPRHIEPEKDVAILLDRLGLTLPAQPPPKVSTKLAETAKSEM